MDNRIEDLYRQLAGGVTRERLKELSVDIIDRYKRKDLDGLRRYAALINGGDGGLDTGRLFAAVIQRYHPDKIAMVRREMESLRAAGDLDGLAKMREIYLTEVRPVHIDRFGDFEYEEEFSFESDEFGYTEKSEYDEDAPSDYEYEDTLDEAENGEGYGFIEAVNGLLFGNLDFRVDGNDLSGLEGELDLSDFEIADLAGIEYCVNITVLNLSANNLRHIGPLALLRRPRRQCDREYRLPGRACEPSRARYLLQSHRGHLGPREDGGTGLR
ncbi:MAG: leucine-rich repeat domain-containing protein [Spirochaetes bacterium]|nr:leucine-rich repeat domain-containing protein [Spirochaetota bacterium]